MEPVPIIIGCQNILALDSKAMLLMEKFYKRVLQEVGFVDMPDELIKERAWEYLLSLRWSCFRIPEITPRLWKIVKAQIRSEIYNYAGAVQESLTLSPSLRDELNKKIPGHVMVPSGFITAQLATLTADMTPEQAAQKIADNLNTMLRKKVLAQYKRTACSLGELIRSQKNRNLTNAEILRIYSLLAPVQKLLESSTRFKNVSNEFLSALTAEFKQGMPYESLNKIVIEGETYTPAEYLKWVCG